MELIQVSCQARLDLTFITALGEEAVGKARTTRMSFKSFVVALMLVVDIINPEADTVHCCDERVCSEWLVNELRNVG